MIMKDFGQLSKKKNKNKNSYVRVKYTNTKITFLTPVPCSSITQGVARNVIPFYLPIKIETSQYRCCNRASECCTWGVQAVRYPNFFSREWKQIET